MYARTLFLGHVRTYTCAPAVIFQRSNRIVSATPHASVRSHRKFARRTGTRRTERSARSVRTRTAPRAQQASTTNPPVPFRSVRTQDGTDPNRITPRPRRTPVLEGGGRGPHGPPLTRFAFACNPRTAAAAHEPARAQPHPIRIPPPRTASLARGRGQVHAGHTRPPRRVDPGREPRIKSGCGQPSYKRPSPPAHRRGAPTPPQPSSRTPSRPPPIDRRNPPRNPTAAAAARPGAFERRCLETERRTRSRRRAAPTSTSRSRGRYARRRSPPLISFLLGRIASVFALVAIVAMQVVA